MGSTITRDHPGKKSRPPFKTRVDHFQSQLELGFSGNTFNEEIPGLSQLPFRSVFPGFHHTHRDLLHQLDIWSKVSVCGSLTRLRTQQQLLAFHNQTPGVVIECLLYPQIILLCTLKRNRIVWLYNVFLSFVHLHRDMKKDPVLKNQNK